MGYKLNVFINTPFNTYLLIKINLIKNRSLDQIKLKKTYS